MGQSSPAKTFFTADTHFLEENIVTNAGRPFADGEEMTRALIGLWNATVPKDGIVYFLGDLTMRTNRAAELLDQLHGIEKHLMFGNHDDRKVRRLPQWTSAQLGVETNIGGRLITMTHYRMHAWNKARSSGIHLHGHHHGDLPDAWNCCDVGVDNPAWEMRPASLDTITAYLGTLPRPPPRTKAEEPTED